MEPWEELDLDDSDLPSLLRPCKFRHHHHASLTSPATSSQPPVLQPCSQSQSQTLISQSQGTRFKISLPASSYLLPAQQDLSQRIIPGPAGAVQTAMINRRAKKCQDLSWRDEQEPVSTQEFLRKVVEDGEDDEEFTHYPWLCALDFLQQEDMVDRSGDLLAVPLCSIKKLNIDRVAQVVALIKSCTPNGLGDLMVTLKDTTGTIGASIHRRVLMEEEFGKDISVGTVLILQKTAVFSPARNAKYLNITLNNVIQVISKDRGPASKQGDLVSSVKLAVPTESLNKSWMPQQSLSQLQGKTEGILKNLKQNATVRGSAHNEKETGKGNVAPWSGYCSNESGRNQNVMVDDELPLMSGDGAIKITEVGIDTDDNEQGVMVSEQPNPSNQGEINKSSSNNHYTSAPENLTKFIDQQNENIDRAKKQRPPLITRTLLPQPQAKWTDEQLDELLAFD